MSSYTGCNVTVKTIIGGKGFGFFACAESDVFVHIKDLQAAGFTEGAMVIGHSAIVDIEERGGKSRVSAIHRINGVNAQPAASVVAASPATKKKKASTKTKAKKPQAPRFKAYEFGQVLEGEIVTLNCDRGFGFINVPGFHGNIFFPMSHVVVEEQGFLEIGDKVKFEVVENNYRKPGDVMAQVRSIIQHNQRKIRQVVERNGDLVVVQISCGGQIKREVRRGDRDGELVDNPTTLAEARAMIGKVIVPPEPINYGKKTNDPSRSQRMKGQGGRKVA